MGKSPGGGGRGIECVGNLRTNVDFVAGVQSAYLLPYLLSAYPHLHGDGWFVMLKRYLRHKFINLMIQSLQRIQSPCFRVGLVISPL
jgi:hypothetical protein